MDPSKMESDGVLDGLLESDFPHLFSFVNQARQKGSRASRCRAKIDLFQFRTGGHQFSPDLSTTDLFASHPRLTEDSGPALLIIEDVDLETIHRLRTYLGANKSFARFLDRFLCDIPSYVFDNDITSHLPALGSTKRQWNHVGFHYQHAREFQKNFHVGFEDIPMALVEDSVYWRRAATYGTMHPCQRMISLPRPGQRVNPRDVETKTDLPPILICRQHCSAWFDVDINGQWKTGVILVEPNFKMPGTIPAQLGRPLYTDLLDRSIIQDRTQECPYRTVLSMLTRHALDRDGPSMHAPPPFRLLEGLYRILVAEWMVLHTYCLRDINTTMWRLHRHRPDTFKSTREFEDTQDILFRMRMRLDWALKMVGEQRTTCAARGTALATSWDGPPCPESDSPVAAAKHDIWTDLVADYDQVLDLLRQDDKRAQENIDYIASLLTILQTSAGVREAERAAEQNRMLLVLAIVATFLLPIGTVSTVLGMEGDWAPGGEHFGLFWVIVLPASVVLMGSMLAFMYWGRQNISAAPVPVKTGAALEALVGQDGCGTGREMRGQDVMPESRRRFFNTGVKVWSEEGV